MVYGLREEKEKKIKSFEDLNVWKKAILVVKKIYLITKEFPQEKLYGLTSQMRRSAISIPSNITEGRTRQTKKEFIQFLFISLGSTSELYTQLIISNELEYLTVDCLNELLEDIDHIKRMLLNLIKSLKNNVNR